MPPSSEPWRQLWRTKERALLYLKGLRVDEAERLKVAERIGLRAELEQAQAEPAAPSRQNSPRTPSDRARVEIPSTLPAEVVKAFLGSPEGVLTLRLGWPASVNHYYEGAVIRWDNAPAGRPPYRAVNIVGAQGKAYAQQVAGTVALLRAQGRVAAPEGRLRVDVTLHAPTRAAYDIDNRMKGLLDALTKAQVWADDSLIDDLRIRRGAVVKGGAAVVQIRALGATLWGDDETDEE